MRQYFCFVLILITLQSVASARTRKDRIADSKANKMGQERQIPFDLTTTGKSLLTENKTIKNRFEHQNVERKNLLRLTAQRLLGFDQNSQNSVKTKGVEILKSQLGVGNNFSLSTNNHTSPSLPDFMMHLHRAYLEDQTFMKSQSRLQGDTIRTFFPFAGKRTSDFGNKPKQMIIHPYSEDVSGSNTLSTVGNRTNRMMVFAFNLSSIAASESIVGVQLKAHGLEKLALRNSAFENSKSLPKIRAALLAVYEIRNWNDETKVYHRLGSTITVRASSNGFTWTSGKMMRLASRARRNRRIVVVKFDSDENKPTYQGNPRILKTLPLTFKEQPEIPESNNQNHTEEAIPFTPILIAYCNDSKKIDFIPEKLPPGMWNKLKALNNETNLKRHRRLAQSQRQTESLLPPSDEMINELPGETDFDSDSSSTISPLIRNDQTELQGNRISDRQVMQKLEDRRSKSRRRKMRRRRSRKCRKRRRNKRKNSRCNEIASAGTTLEPNLNRMTPSCSRRSLRVDFEEIGWSEWIISPKHFDAYFCSGVCQFNTIKDASPSNHAIIQSFINKFQINPEVPKPCCVPESLESLSVLYFDQNDSVVLKVYPNMSVEKCACR